MAECIGTHRFFLADVAVVPGEGKVYVIALCTACGLTICSPHVVAFPHAPIVLLKEEQRVSKQNSK